MVVNEADLRSIHRFSSRHRDLLAKSEQAGCFYCQRMFPPNEILDWVDGRQVETGDLDDGVTALCPKCGIDAVLPSAAPITLTPDLLAQMRRFFFDT